MMLHLSAYIAFYNLLHKQQQQLFVATMFFYLTPHDVFGQRSQSSALVSGCAYNPVLVSQHRLSLIAFPHD